MVPDSMLEGGKTELRNFWGVTTLCVAFPTASPLDACAAATAGAVVGVAETVATLRNPGERPFFSFGAFKALLWYPY